MGDFYKDVGKLGSFQGDCLPEPQVGAGEELEARAESRIIRLIEPLKERRRILLASKEMHQVAQDLEDEMVRLQPPLQSSDEKFLIFTMWKCPNVLPSTLTSLIFN